MSQGRQAIRSYQRIFRPERRIYQLEGHRLPVPGGVPLRWLAWAAGTLVAIVAISSGSAVVLVLGACLAALAGATLGGSAVALAAAAAAIGGGWAIGFVLDLLDWPLRLVVLPVALATFATQATPDGRGADRFALSWLALRLSPARRSLGRGLPGADVPRLLDVSIWVAPDEGSARLRAARITGAGIVWFAAPVLVRRSGRHGERLRARPASSSRARRGERPGRSLAMGSGETVEVRA
ncbi:MAG TPA: TcpE family conjugal transfer membrane protein [Solirubrobacterales bacterium]|nr:TcpE family conjugal transfer membrane protein [Solirubrobacterales bacterium]